MAVLYVVVACYFILFHVVVACYFILFHVVVACFCCMLLLYVVVACCCCMLLLHVVVACFYMPCKAFLITKSLILIVIKNNSFIGKSSLIIISRLGRWSSRT